MPVSLHSILASARAIVFDAVGTLIHPEPRAAAVYVQVGRRYGSQRSSDEIACRFRRAFSDEEEHDWRNLHWRTTEERELQRWQSIVRSVLSDVTDIDACFQELFAHFGQPEAWRCDPDAEEVLAALAEGGWTLALASNYDRRLHPVAEGLAPLRRISHRFVSSEVGWRKPAQPFFRHVARELGVLPSQIVFVGDDPYNDYYGASEVGMEAVLFDPHGKETAEHIVRITRLRELIGK
jgi:putative hydrolase of the HAD superfamily